MKKDYKNLNEILNKVICDYSVEEMKCIPDNSIHLIIASSPFNVGMNYDGIKNKNREWPFEDVRERVQWYKDPLVDALTDKMDGAQVRVKMYE